MTSDTIRTDYVLRAFTAKRSGALAAPIAQNTALVLVTKFSFSRGVTRRTSSQPSSRALSR